MKHAATLLTAGACLLVTMGGVVLAADKPQPTTGQPGASAGVTCFSSASTAQAPGGSMTSPGSVFNPNGQSGTVYAGQPGTPSLANGSSAAVSQYDIACQQVTTHSQMP
jgi:hypothetical protein